MLKTYCQKCGGLNTYVSEKPNFCQKCGNIFGHAPKNALVMDEIEESSASLETLDPEEYGNIPDIDHLDVEIDVRGPTTLKVGDIAGKEFNTRAPEDKIESESADFDGWEEFQREASAIKPNEKGGKKET